MRFTQEGSYHFVEGVGLFLPLQFNVLMQGMELKFGEAPKRRWYMVAGHLFISYFPVKTEWKSLSLKFKCNYKCLLWSSPFYNQIEIRSIIKQHSNIKDPYRHPSFDKGSCCCSGQLVCEVSAPLIMGDISFQTLALDIISAFSNFQKQIIVFKLMDSSQELAKNTVLILQIILQYKKIN